MRLTCACLAALLALPTAGQTETVTEEFRRVCEEVKAGANTYFTDRLARQIEAQMPAGFETMDRQAAAHGVLGREYLRLGRTEESIEQLQLARTLVAEHSLDGGLRSSVDWNLALAHLQRAEDLNCVGHRNAASCILPLSPEAVHELPEHSKIAGDLFAEYAERHPRNVQAVWLLNLARRVSGDFPRGVPERWRLTDDRLGGDVDFPTWIDRAPVLGVNALDLAGGAVVDDFDGDGDLDLVSSTWDPCDGMKAYRNDRGTFTDVTEAWGLTGQLGGLNLNHADADGDGRLDLLVLRGAWLLGEGKIRNSLLRNVARDGAPFFRDVTREAGLAAPAFPTQTAAWADIDGDGDLDLFVGNESTQGNPAPSQLYVNDGKGRFTEVAERAGVSNFRYSKGTAFGDVDNDGDEDLFVSNFGENRLFINQGIVEGAPRFVDVAAQLGLLKPERESFATWFFDFDNDGDLDLFVADYRSQAGQVTASYFGARTDVGQPLLYRNDLDRGEGLAFTEISRSVGIERPAMPMGANYGDLDNDGWLDVYLGTGEPDLASLMPNVMYRNRGGRFVDVTFAGGFGHLQKGHGIALGDLDNDGDQDLFHQLGGFYPGDSFGNALFENPGNDNAWVTLLLEGRKANRFGIGARIEARVESAGEVRSVHLHVSDGGSFGSSSLQQEIGLGAADRLVQLTVTWPGSGTVDVLEGLALRRTYRVVEGERSAEPVERPAFDLVARNAP
ncbi:MAG: CRTAC1 family protein [Acidobacteriota bacterium]